MKFDVVILGAGLGGLECGYTLSKNGYKVCVLEQNPLLGGCLQTFKRKGTSFDTGFHYIGGLAEGQHLNHLFHYFDLMSLPWKKLDETCFDEVIFNGKSYAFANGYEPFIETLAKEFPNQKENLKQYIATLSEIGRNIFHSFSPRDAEEFYQSKAFTQSAYDFLNETISDPTLRNVLAGTSLKMELHPEKLPLYIFAQINDSFIQSAWRIEGGGMQIAQKLAQSIEQQGGTIRTHAKVVELIEEEGQISRAILSNGEEIEGSYFISNIHPVGTLNLIHESKVIRNIYKRRITNMANTYGMFTANLQLKDGEVPYLNRNIYLYETNDIWSYHHYQEGKKTDCVLVSYQTPEKGQSTTRNIDLLTPMTWQEVSHWENTSVMKRGDDYNNMKVRKAEECIELATKRLPELRGNIENCYTSTPLTYTDYTGTYHGSAYGIQKDHAQLAYTMLTPKSPLKNLFLTGQNLNLHGILGVSMTSFFTCAEIMGMEKIREELSL